MGLFTVDQIEEIVNAQIHSLLWSAGEYFDENGEFVFMWDERYDKFDAIPELREKLVKELEEFPMDLAEDVTYYRDNIRRVDNDRWTAYFGHDIALTRNGHGAGFWDRGLGESGDKLTGWSETLGELTLFETGDGKFSAE